MKKLILLFSLLLPSLCFALAKGDSIAINHFVVKEDPYHLDQVSIVATDSANTNTISAVSGQFIFTINGFDDTLKFDKGVAFYEHKIEHSSFIYARHENATGTHSMLYYVYKGNKLMPVHISWVVLIAIPVVLVLLGYMFRKFIIVAIIIFIAFVYFNHHSGLDIGTFFSSIIDGMRSIF